MHPLIWLAQTYHSSQLHEAGSIFGCFLFSATQSTPERLGPCLGEFFTCLLHIYGRCPCVGCHQVNMGVQNFAMYGVTWCDSFYCFHGNSPHRNALHSHHHYTSSLHRNAPHSHHHDARGSWSIQS